MPVTADITDQLTTILLKVSALAKDGFNIVTDNNKNIFQKAMALVGIDRESAAKKLGAPVDGTPQEKEAYMKNNPVPKRTGSVTEAFIDSMPQFASGGIANFNKSGGLAMLHGTEAVVPLPDGKTIPVSVDTEQIAKALQPTSIPLSVNTDEMSNLFNTYTAGMRDLIASSGVATTDEARLSNLLNTGMKDVISSNGVLTTDEARRLLMSEPQRVAGASRSTLPGSINADQLVPAVATAVNEVQSQPKPSESADTELLETLIRQVAELVKLSSRQLNVSQQTRSQLM